MSTTAQPAAIAADVAATRAPRERPEAPWMTDESFGVHVSPYGYVKGETREQCSFEELARRLRADTERQITLVWTPLQPHLTPPEEVPLLFDAVRERTRAAARKELNKALLNGAIYGGLVVTSLLRSRLSPGWVVMLLSFGLWPALSGGWELLRMRRYTPAAMAQDIPNARFLVWMRGRSAQWTLWLVALVGAVEVTQLLLWMLSWTGLGQTKIEAAAIVKDAVRGGEYWRLLTGTLLHANIIHFVFNITSLFVLGRLLEALLHRAYLPLVFLAAALGGSLCSLLADSRTSVGASGGIMGMVGLLLVVGAMRRRVIPPRFFGTLLVSVAMIAGTGLAASQLIDNAAHAGGLLTGLALGLLLERRASAPVPLPDTPALRWAGWAGAALVAGVGALTLALLIGTLFIAQPT